MTTVRFVLALALFPALATAQDTHTLSLTEGETSPPATLNDVAWLAGHWRGDGLGGISESIYFPPEAGVMQGMFRHIRDGEIVFYELIALREEEGTLVLRLKHFNADLTAWEEKEEMVVFPLVRVEKDAVYFDGLTYRRVGDERHAWVEIQNADGETFEAPFVYRRLD